MKMTNEIRIKMAECEGWSNISCPLAGLSEPHGVHDDRMGEHGCEEIPTYADDNDLCRFIRGMDDPERFSYFVALTDIVEGIMSSDIFKATEEQKQEAIAKAKGWEESA